MLQKNTFFRQSFNVLVFSFFFIAFISVFFPRVASAAFFIEPFLGQRQEKIQFTDLTATNFEYKTSGLTYGLNAGVTTATGIFFNLSGSQFKAKAETTPTQSDTPEFTHNNAALQVGVSAMGLLKIYLGYMLLNEVEIKTQSPFSSFKLKGPGYQVGLSLTLISRLSLGLQYNIHQFNDISGASYASGNDTKTYFNKVDSQDIFAYLAYSF